MTADSIKSFRLMTEKEYRRNEDLVVPVKGLWWLGTPGLNRMSVMIVCNDRVSPIGISVDARHIGVRPVITIDELLGEGERIELLGESWTAFSHDSLICDRIVTTGCFNSQKHTEWASDFKGSSVERTIYKWAKEQGCPLEVPSPSMRGSKIRVIGRPVLFKGMMPPDSEQS